jgi:hypothetical protein
LGFALVQVWTHCFDQVPLERRLVEEWIAERRQECRREGVG